MSHYEIEIENENGKAYKFNKETTFPIEKAEKFLVDSIDNDSIYFDKGYHRYMGWDFIPKGYSKFLVKYSLDYDSQYMTVFAKTLEKANQIFSEKYEDIELFAIIPEPKAFKNILCEDDTQNRFTTIDFNFEDHHVDMNNWLHNNNVECLVDEEKGGIIAYYHKDSQDIILDKMNA